MDDVLIEGNNIYGDIGGNSLAQVFGIYAGALSHNLKIRRNTIHDIYSSATSGMAQGIYISSDDAAEMEISNNAIYAIKGGGRAASANPGAFISGICIQGGGNMKICSNSVYLSGDVLGSAAYDGVAACIYLHSNVTGIDIRNNLLRNSMGRKSGVTNTPKAFLIYSVAPIASYLLLDYNDYYFTDQPNVTEYLGYQVGSGNISDLAGWKTATGQDGHSYSTDPHFTSATNLQPAASYYLQGTAVTGITIDILGVTRLSPPSLGAYEGAFNGRWNGTVSTDWSVAGNWDNSHIPSESESIFISSPPLNQPHVTAAISSPLVCNNITIYTGASLTIDAGKALTVTGTLVNEAGNDGLVIAGDATGTGSLIHTSAAVAAKASLYLPGNSQAWHFLASPVAAQPISPAFTAEPAASYDFFTWYEPTGEWVNFKNTTVAPTWNTANGDYNFTVGKGYLAEYTGTGLTKQFSGNLNAGSISVPVTQSGSGAYAAYTLAGNPYPSAIDWIAASGWTRTSLNESGGGYNMWTWNDAAGNYGSFNSAGSSGINGGSRYIPMGQGFMVSAASAGTLGMTDDIRVHSSQSFIKSAETITNTIRMKVTGSANSYSDEVVIEFGHPSASGGAGKMFSFYETAPALYSVKPEGKYSVDFRGEPGPITIQLNFKAGTDGNFQLTAGLLESFSSTVAITLEDLKLAKIQNLVQNPVYSFSATRTDAEGRFLLHFGGTFGVENNEHSNSASIYSSGNLIYISGITESMRQGEVIIYNMIGQPVKRKPLGSNSLTKISLEAPAGYYLVKVILPDHVYSRKVFVDQF